MKQPSSSKLKHQRLWLLYKEAITSWNNTGAFNFPTTDDKLKANIIADERYEENVASPSWSYLLYLLCPNQAI